MLLHDLLLHGTVLPEDAVLRLGNRIALRLQSILEHRHRTHKAHCQTRLQQVIPQKRMVLSLAIFLGRIALGKAMSQAEFARKSLAVRKANEEGHLNDHEKPTLHYYEEHIFDGDGVAGTLELIQEHFM